MHRNSPDLIKNLYNKIRIFKGIQITEFSMKTIPKLNVTKICLTANGYKLYPPPYCVAKKWLSF